ncbi:MAG: hypothetical protein RIS76_3474 [Verrucomicrobiota bacterium]|jgi:hypothetical protein
MHHVFVDFENVHRVDPSVFGTQGVCFTLLLGAHQTKLDVALVEKLMEYAASVQLVRLTSSGKNALDFSLAYYVGRAAVTDPSGCFHIVSRDKGFEPLIEHLRSRNLQAHRHTDFTTLTFSEAARPGSVASDELLTRVLGHLGKNAASRPKRKKTLMSHLLALCGKAATEEDVVKLVEGLLRGGHITIGDRDVVTYRDSSSLSGGGLGGPV